MCYSSDLLICVTGQLFDYLWWDGFHIRESSSQRFGEDSSQTINLGL